MTYRYENGMAVDIENNLRVIAYAPPNRDMASHGDNKWWGLFEDKNKSSYFYVPYFRFDHNLVKNNTNFKFVRFVFFRECIFYSYLAAELNNNNFTKLHQLYKNFLSKTSFLNEASPPYEVFSRPEFHQFILKHVHKDIFEKKTCEFNAILSGFVDAISIITRAGGSGNNPKFKIETAIFDADMKTDELKVNFDRDALIFDLNAEI
jgi:hypothetical protein